MADEKSRDGMGRRDFLRVGAGAAAVGVMAALEGKGVFAQGAPAVKRPNIVYVFADEHRWCSLPFTESPQVIAPNLVRLAKEGLRFDNCISTSPICVPHRAMLLTGRWPHDSSFISNDYVGDSDSIGKTGATIAQTFKKAGYATGYVGKWHLDEKSVYNAGFDYHKNWLYGDDHWNTQWRDVPSKEAYQVYKGYNAIGMTDQALEFLGASAKKGVDGSEPFLLMLSLNPPHFRWDDVPAEYVKLYPQDKLEFRPNVTDPKFKQGTSLRDYQHYHAHITAVDVQVGRVLDEIKKLGLEENTVVIYSSDHGSSWGSNDVTSKGNPFDEAIRVPFIVKWPGQVAANKVVDNLIGTTDIHATLCGLAGVKPPANCGGRDYTPVLLGKEGPDPETQMIMVNNFQRNYYRTVLEPKKENSVYPYRGVRSKRYTYAVYAEGEWLLYDNQKDPYQLKSLVNDPAYAEIKAGLAKELDGRLAKAEEPFISPEWKKLSLPERIAVENRHYAVLPSQKQWDKYKADAVAVYLKGATAGQQKQLLASADGVFDEEFFGPYIALFLDSHNVVRYSKRPVEEVKKELAELEVKYAEKMKVEAGKILAAGG